MKTKLSINSLRWFGKGFPVDVTLTNFTLIPCSPLAIEREGHFPVLSITVCFPSPAEQRQWAPCHLRLRSGVSTQGSLGTTVPSDVVKRQTEVDIPQGSEMRNVSADLSLQHPIGPCRLLNAYCGDAPQLTDQALSFPFSRQIDYLCKRSRLRGGQIHENLFCLKFKASGSKRVFLYHKTLDQSLLIVVVVT